MILTHIFENFVITSYSLECLYSAFILYLISSILKVYIVFFIPLWDWQGAFWTMIWLFPPYLKILSPPTVLWWELLRNDSKFFLQPQLKPCLSSGYSTLLRIETIHKFKLLLLWFSDKHLLQHILKIRWWKQQNLLLTNLDHLECSQVPRILFKASRHFFLSNIHSP